jgi:squalene-associated FAD-dependent desaturase
MNIAVIGGGWAGIAAAVELAASSNPKVAVSLFEAGRHLGGRARQIAAPAPFLALDNGQHLLLGAYRETLALMRRIGVSPEEKLHRLPLKIQDNRGFRLALPRLRAPFHLAWGFLAMRKVSWAEKYATVLWMQRLRRQHFELDEDTSVAGWLDDAGQTGILRQRLWEPLCLAALNIPAERASARIFAHVLRDSLGSLEPGATDLLLPRGTLSDLLPEPAARWLPARGARILTGRRIRKLTQVKNGWQVEDETFDQVILAVAPQHLAALLPMATDAPLCLSRLAHEPIATLYLAYPAHIRLPFPLMALQGGIGQWLFDRGEGVLAAVFSGHGNWEALEEEALATALHEEIVPMINTKDLPPYFFIKAQRATFACTPDLPRCPPNTSWPGLWVAGDHTWSDYPATLEGGIRSGIRAARLCLQNRFNADD